jgi:polyphosphate kinase
MTTAQTKPTTSTTPPSDGAVARDGPAAQTVAPGVTQLAQPVTDQSSRYLNRELQWLEFNERVLSLALDERTPLLERLRFLAIHASNLDEFFQKRVGGLRRQLAAGIGSIGPEIANPAWQLATIRQRLLSVTQRAAECYRQQILPALRQEGVFLLDYSELSKSETRQVDEWYRHNVFPVLTPLAVDPGHRFPFISNLSTSLGVMLRRPGDSEQLFARVKVPRVVPQWCRLTSDGKVGSGGAGGGTHRFVALADIIEANLASLFSGMEIMKVLPFRVTRNADIADDNEDAEDLLEQIQQQLRERRFAPVVRLQITRKPNRRLLQYLRDEMEMQADDIYETQGLVDYTVLNDIADLDLPHLKYKPWRPVIPARLSNHEQDIFSAIRQGDILVHHPYESFDGSVERFVEEAAGDANVVAIKQALYRTSGDSPFVRELARAAERGKQVAVLVELRARFDEARNIEWARWLEDSGVHVAYGVVGLKVHTKITLVVRREPDGLRAYSHISTGNYNSKTADIYEDLGLLTCDPVICDDIIDLFNSITGRSRAPQYSKLLVAPQYMKKRFIELIERETQLHSRSGGGRIVAKMNQLQDQEMIEALYRASEAGVKIDLIVRGFCTLRPGVPGMSENIRVMAIIGRFLEHGRIFYFRNGQDDPRDGDYYIGSADWMYRNLNARVEAVCPIEDRTLRSRLWQILNVCLNDQRQGWDMQSDGSYVARTPTGLPEGAVEALGTHQALMNLTLQSRQQQQEPETE